MVYFLAWNGACSCCSTTLILFSLSIVSRRLLARIVWMRVSGNRVLSGFASYIFVFRLAAADPDVPDILRLSSSASSAIPSSGGSASRWSLVLSLAR